MLDTGQIKNITFVYNKLLASEVITWDSIDEYLEMVDWLDNDQLSREASALYSKQKYRNMGCGNTHANGSVCWVKNIMDAVGDILDLYEETANLHINNRYILSYYLALVQSGQIIEA